MVREMTSSPMEISIKESTRMASQTVMESILGQMEVCMLATSSAG